jgi:transglutaminase-like putative cysteine protease
MRWAVSHETVYGYSVPVTFAPHIVRLTPRADRAIVTSRTLEIEPVPLSRHDWIDGYGNPYTRVEFGPTPSTVLRVHSRTEVEPLVLPAPESVALPPLPWLAPPFDDLADFRRSEDLGPGVDALVREVSATAGSGVVATLDLLCGTLYSRMDRGIRLDGPAQPPEVTLALSRGACRDITMVFLAVCRRLGIAARFVSGYQGAADTPDGRRHLHAWPEAFLPGLGWQGWDPMHGIRVGDGHIALCVAPSQEGTMPVEGGFYFQGATVNSTLDYTIRVAEVRPA